MKCKLSLIDQITTIKIKMHIYLGTYSGQLFIIQDFPNSLKFKKSLQVSQSSVRSLLKVNNCLLFATYAQQLKVYNSVTQNEILDQKDDEGGKVTFMKAKDQRYVILGMQNGSVKLFDLKFFTVSKNERGHKKAIQEIIIDKDSKLMVTACRDKLCFWAVQDFKKVYEYKLGLNIRGVLATDDFSSIFIVGDKQVRQFSTETNTQVAKLQVVAELGQIQSHLLHEDHLIVGTSSGYVLIWKKGQYNHFIKFKAHSTRVKISKAVIVYDIAYLITGSSDGQIKVWDVLQFIKEVQKISQDYYLEGLKPLLEINIGQRLLCIDVQKQSNIVVQTGETNIQPNSLEKVKTQKSEGKTNKFSNKNNSKKQKSHVNIKQKDNNSIKQKDKSQNNAEYYEKVKKIKKFQEKTNRKSKKG